VAHILKMRAGYSYLAVLEVISFESNLLSRYL
jgi:hypothetical protein